MSRTNTAGLAASHGSLGPILRGLRQKLQLPLWKVAAAADMDSTLLSKIELGQRLPTEEQTAALAAYFGVPAAEFEGARIADKFLKENGHKPDAAAIALSRIQESCDYLKRKTSVSSKSGRSANKPQKRK